MRRRKTKFNIKKLLLFVLIVILLILLVIYFVAILFSNNKSKDIKINKNNYTNSFIDYGITAKKTKLYYKEKSKYTVIGTIEKNVYLDFDKLDGKYLLLKNFDSNYYIRCEDIKKGNSKKNIDDRYKNYIKFNENIVTNDKTSFYDENDDLLYVIYNSYDLPIIVKDNDRYGVEVNNNLLFVHNDDVKIIKDSINTDKSNSSGVGVLNYHFFYDDNNNEESKDCNEEICISKSQFISELDYFKESNILPIKSKELEWYIDGKVQLPKSVYITIDDGGRTKIAVDLLKQYKYYATIFLVTSWYDPNDYYTNEYIELHSHTDNMHNQGDCPGGQGGGIKCLDEDKILNDLKTSRDKLAGSTVIAYPFYEYNNYSIEMLKKTGFHMAFVGESAKSDNLVHVGSNKYILPRFVMVNYTTKKDFDKYFGNIK